MGVLTSLAVVDGVAHLNPAVTVGLAAIGNVEWADVPQLIAGQFIGAFIGALLVYLAYLPHWAETEDQGLKLAVFCTAPAIRNVAANTITEIIGTAMLVFGVLAIGTNGAAVSPPAGLFVALLVLGIGMSLGGPTGYAINPARDLGPRIMHFILRSQGRAARTGSTPGSRRRSHHRRRDRRVRRAGGVRPVVPKKSMGGGEPTR